MKNPRDLKNFNIKDLFSGVGKNLSWLFFAGFLLLLLLEALEINNSVQIVLSANKPSQLTLKQPEVRVDFTDYNNILQRIQQAQNFSPNASSSMPNPFGIGQ